MALKDWKKVRDGTDTWENKVKGGRIRVYRFSKGYEVAGKYPWSVYNAIEDKQDVFKTKSQAINFAKSYMRSH